MGRGLRLGAGGKGGTAASPGEGKEPLLSEVQHRGVTLPLG